MLFSNFFIAALTHIATRFIDDKRNEKIRIYIESIDNLLGVITAQLSKNSNLDSILKGCILLFKYKLIRHFQVASV